MGISNTATITDQGKGSISPILYVKFLFLMSKAVGTQVIISSYGTIFS